jgi:hypothetical protein
MVTILAAVRFLELPVSLAFLLQVGIGGLGIASTLWLWWSEAPEALRVSTLVAATFLFTPFAYDYDLALLILPLAWLLRTRSFHRWSTPERTLFIVLWMLPGVAAPLVTVTGIPLTPAVLLLLLRLAHLGFSKPPPCQPVGEESTGR